jgi:RNA polymerase sigma-70 factor (ECF subfamily)
MEESPELSGEAPDSAQPEFSSAGRSRSTPSERFRGHLSEALVNELFEQVALERSHEAFDELYDLLFPKAYAQVFRVLKSEEDARDLTQEVFAQVWEKAPDVYPHRNSAGWIIEMAKRRAIDETRSSRFRHARNSDAFDTDAHEHLLNHTNLSDDEFTPEKLERRIALAMEALTPSQRRVMELVFAGKSYREISTTLQATEGAIRKTVFDAYRKIRPLVLSGKSSSRNNVAINVASNGSEQRIEGTTAIAAGNGSLSSERGPKEIKTPRKQESEQFLSRNGAAQPRKQNASRKKDRAAFFAELPEMELVQTPLDKEKDALLRELEEHIHPPLSHST